MLRNVLLSMQKVSTPAVRFFESLQSDTGGVILLKSCALAFGLNLSEVLCADDQNDIK